jgi:hypothetical protein
MYFIYNEHKLFRNFNQSGVKGLSMEFNTHCTETTFDGGVLYRSCVRLFFFEINEAPLCK